MSKFISDETLAEWLGYHAPSAPEIADAHSSIRHRFFELATFLNGLLPEGPDKTVALRAVRSAMYDANACLAVAQKLYVE